MSVLVLDCETIPNINLLRQEVSDSTNLTEEELVTKFFSDKGTPEKTFLPVAFHSIVSMSILLKSENDIILGDACTVDRSTSTFEEIERSMVQQFFSIIDDMKPTVVTWNGKNFDTALLQYKAMQYGIQSGKYWDTGYLDQSAKWSQYTSRYHDMHIDMKDIICSYNINASTSLDAMSHLIGLPGKVGIGGEHVWDAYKDGKIADIIDYCNVDTINTYIIYLRFSFIRGKLSKSTYNREIGLLLTEISKIDSPAVVEYYNGLRAKLPTV